LELLSLCVVGIILQDLEHILLGDVIDNANSTLHTNTLLSVGDHLSFGFQHLDLHVQGVHAKSKSLDIG